jgi:transcriptional regulator with XRE-family HTH domain
MAPPLTFFAVRLTRLRETAGITKYRLAKRAGLTGQAVTRLELGQGEPNWNTVQKLAAALGADVRDFVDPTIQAVPDKAPRKAGRKPKGKGK